MFINQINKENYKKKKNLDVSKTQSHKTIIILDLIIISNSDLILLNDSIDPVLYES
jgi:hypothetical protein